MAAESNCETCLLHSGVVTDLKNLHEKVNTMEKIGIAILVALVANFLAIIGNIAYLLSKML